MTDSKGVMMLLGFSIRGRATESTKVIITSIVIPILH